MNCRAIKELLQSLPIGLDVRDEGDAHFHESIGQSMAEVDVSSQWAAVRAHLDSCKECRAEYAAEKRWDELVSGVIRDVPIPAGLLERIVLSLSEQDQVPDCTHQPVSMRGLYPEPSQPVLPSDRKVTRRRALRWGALVASGLAATGGFWWFRSRWQPDAISLGDLAKEITAPNYDWSSLQKYEGEVPSLPSPKEMQIPEGVRGTTPLGLKNRGKQVAAVFRFPSGLLPGGQPAAEIVLAVFDLHQTRVQRLPSAETFSQAEYLYLHDRAVKIWGSLSTAYCCFATGSGTSWLDALVPRDTIA